MRRWLLILLHFIGVEVESPEADYGDQWWHHKKKKRSVDKQKQPT